MTSDKVVFRLPERIFTQPLAKAVIEQRRKLVRDPDDHVPVARALSALTYYPKDLIKTSGIFLGMRHAVNRLMRSNDDVTQEVADLLWDIALTIEDGDLSLAERELRAAQRDLQKALADNARRRKSPSWSKTCATHSSATCRRWPSVCAVSRRRQQMPDGARQLQSQDLDNMLDTIENLARAGARDAAQNMLSQLQSILENLQAGRIQQGMSEQDAAMARMIEQLGKMMQEQQQLMDRTYQEPPEAGNEPGARGGTQTIRKASASNSKLWPRPFRNFSTACMRRGANPPSALGQAEQSMQDATGALREDDRRVLSASRARPSISCARAPRRWPNN